MKNDASILGSLDRVIGARDDRELAEHALRIYAKLVPGDYHSAVYYAVNALATDIFHPCAGWCGPSSSMATFLQKNHLKHPFARHFFLTRQSACYRRSEMIADREWKRSLFYNELDRPLGIEDMAAIYQGTGNGDIIVLTCGRSSAFRQKDIDSAGPFHRVLSSLVQSRRTPRAGLCSQSDAAKLLSKREREVMGWVREGKRNSEISVILGLSTHTVRKHLENAFWKLGVETRTAAALMFSAGS